MLAIELVPGKNSLMHCVEHPLPPPPVAGWLRVWALRGAASRPFARNLLEQTLMEAAASHARVAAGSVAIRRQPSGQPIFAGLPLGYACGLAYTHGLALAALTGGIGVGVDCENLDFAADWRGVAAGFLSTADRRDLEAMEPPRDKRSFFRAWTRREALAKAHGLERPISSSSPGLPAEPGANWTEIERGTWLIDLTLGEEFAGCAAVTANADRT
jgi:phosphopantetheinyl transferase